MSKFPSLKDHFLIAMPSLIDPNFYHSVTYIIEHNEEGAMGMVINQPLEVDLNSLFKHLEIEIEDGFMGNKKVMAGGPVQIERGFIIHSPLGDWDSSLIINSDVAVTTSKDILMAISKGEGPKDIEIVLGYAGWTAGQLDQEILDNSWLSVPANPEILFCTPPEHRWKAAAQLLGIDTSQLSSEDRHG